MTDDPAKIRAAILRSLDQAEAADQHLGNPAGADVELSERELLRRPPSETRRRTARSELTRARARAEIEQAEVPRTT